MLGVNYQNKHTLWSATCHGYAAAVNHLFLLHDFLKPTNFDNKENMGTTVLHNLKREEDITTQRSLLTSDFFVELKRMSDAPLADSPEQVVFNMPSFGRITGLQASKYAKKTQTWVEIHKYPSGKRVTKAFPAEDFDFFDRNKLNIRIFNESSFKKLHSTKFK